MSQDLPTLLSVERLIELGRTGPARALAADSRQSYPMPARHPRWLRMVFLYCGARSDYVQGQLLVAPSYIASLIAETGQLEAIREVTPAEFGQAPGNPFIGAHTLPPDMTLAESFVQQRVLFQAYDLLLPSFAMAATAVTDEVRGAAATFR